MHKKLEKVITNISKNYSSPQTHFSLIISFDIPKSLIFPCFHLYFWYNYLVHYCKHYYFFIKIGFYNILINKIVINNSSLTILIHSKYHLSILLCHHQTICFESFTFFLSVWKHLYCNNSVNYVSICTSKYFAPLRIGNLTF